MRMRVIPVESWRLVIGYVHHIADCLSWHRHHRDDIVLRCGRGDVKPMEMQVRHVDAWSVNTVLSRPGRHLIYILHSDLATGSGADDWRNLAAIKGERSLSALWIVDRS
jgi:hypothetical protein